MQWDRTKLDKPKISDTYHTDIGDAVLYAWRECKHFIYEAVEKKPARNSIEWMEGEEDQLMEQLERAKNSSDVECSQEELESLFNDE